jgi:hypothetical protein
MRFYVFIPLLNPCYGAKHVVDQFTNHPPEIANDLVENATQEAAVNQAQNSKKMGGGDHWAANGRQRSSPGSVSTVPGQAEQSAENGRHQSFLGSVSAVPSQPQQTGQPTAVVNAQVSTPFSTKIENRQQSAPGTAPTNSGSMSSSVPYPDTNSPDLLLAVASDGT